LFHDSAFFVPLVVLLGSGAVMRQLCAAVRGFARISLVFLLGGGRTLLNILVKPGGAISKG